MPTIKRAGIKSEVTKTGFEAYDGPEITRNGVFRAKIISAKYKKFRTGSEGLLLSLILEAAKGDPKNQAQFDGMPLYTNLVFGDKEMMIAREQNFYAAIGAKSEPAILTEDGDIESGVKIKKIGGKDPVGCYVNIDVRMRANEGIMRPEIDGILKLNDIARSASKASADEDDEDDLLEDEIEVEVEDDDEEEEDVEVDDEEDDETEAMPDPDERRAELEAATLKDLKTLAVGDYDLSITGLKKSGIVDAIVEYEFSEDEGPMALSDDEEEDEDEIEVEVEDDEEEDDEEEDDEEDERAARAEELSSLSRIELKGILKGLDPEIRILKSQTDEALAETILGLEFSEEAPY